MTQLRKLKPCVLQKAAKTKQPNGVVIDLYADVKPYKVTLQELTDQVSASVYGANVNKTCRIHSPKNELEEFLDTKVNNEEDNISKYFILIKQKRYKIVSVKSEWLDIELI